MKTRLVFCVMVMGLGAAVVLAQEKAVRSMSANRLTPAEKAAGWKLLFDGRTSDGWRGYRKEAFPAKGWVIEDGCLKVVAGAKGGDIITKDQYGDFELALEWRVAPRANSGIMYRVTEKHGASWQTGPEYQLLDDIGHGAAPDNPHSAGALYGLYSPSADKVAKPAGEFNRTRIVIKDNRLTHWLNGRKVVDIDLDSELIRKGLERRWGKDSPVYQLLTEMPKKKTPISLQHHNDEVWVRNIRIRHLD